MVTGKQPKGSINFDLNLIPFIDILSTCICFLLMTTVFIHLAALETKQALGNETASDKPNPPSLFVKMRDDNNLVFMLKDIETGKQPREFSIRTVSGGQIDWSQAGTVMDRLRTTYPTMTTALVLPSEKTKYQDMIRFMDELKKRTYADVGVAPL